MTALDIHGLQKLTLLDFPGKTACTLFLGGCNLRCPYCHNKSLVIGPLPPPLSREEVFAFLRKRRGLLDGVCVTGGEPLLHPDLPALLSEIKALGYAVKLDTNGTFPAPLRRVVEEGLADYVAMDLKHAPGGYARAAGIADFDPAPVRESAEILLAGPVPYEFRITVAEGLHREEDFLEMGPWIEGARAVFLQPFRDAPEILCPGLRPPSPQAMARYAELLRPYVGQVSLRGMQEEGKAEPWN